MSRTLQALCVATCAFAMLVAPASAAPTARDRTAVAVRYGDLNLDSEMGAKVLLRRLDQAARDVCGGDAYARGLVRHAWRDCRTDAMTKAIAQVNHPTVTTMFAEQRNARTILASR